MKKPLLAKSFDADKTNPRGWWMSEKLDGLRAIWDGRTFRSRNGNAFAAPAWFTKDLPAIPLDGELWVGRGAFDRASSIVRSSTDKGWADVRFMVFDIPLAEAGGFEQRQGMLAKLAETWGSYAETVRQVVCESQAHLAAFVDTVIDHGGEGAMLRRPGSAYEHKRSTTLLKVKRFHDAEARVVGYQPGKGKHAGTMGALDCVTAEGVAFQVGTGFTDALRAAPPAIGATITYRYQELTKTGTPRFPSFLRIRLPE